VKEVKYENHAFNAGAVASKTKNDFIKEAKASKILFAEYSEDIQTKKLGDIYDQCAAAVAIPESKASPSLEHEQD
jgi:hypothetical protein